MNAILKVLFISIAMFVLPIAIHAQVGKAYVLPSGEKTIISNRTYQGLDSPDYQFLKNDANYSAKDLFINKSTKYKSLEEAAYDTNNLLKQIEDVMKETLESNESLGFRLSSKTMKHKIAQNEAKIIADSLMRIESEMSKQQLVDLMLKFGNKPTYYVNGVEVDAEVVGLIKEKDILSKNVTSAGAMSGNPNGEIMIEITPSAAQKLNLDDGEYQHEYTNSKNYNKPTSPKSYLREEEIIERSAPAPNAPLRSKSGRIQIK